MMRILVTGAAGQLGSELMKQLQVLGIPCKGVDQQDFDLTDAEAVREAVVAYKPTAILHCAAYTAVDRAESEPEICIAVNGMGTLNMVRAALAVDAKLMYVSTDYVFHGNGDTPFETNEPYYPQNVYGLAKAQGEEAVRSLMTRFFIVRTSWVFGQYGHNFVRTMLRLGSERRQVNVVNDQVGSPTYVPDLARLMLDMIQTDRYGIYHVTNEGYCSWAEFAAEIMKRGGRDCTVKPVLSSEYPAAAHRPLNSRMSKRSLDQNGFRRLPTWEDALDRYLTVIGEKAE